MTHIIYSILIIFIFIPSHSLGQSDDEYSVTQSSTLEARQSDLSTHSKSRLDRPTVSGEPTELRYLLYILDVDEVDSAEQNFAASVYVEVRWNDASLKHPGSGPIIKPSTEVWTPHLVIVNEQKSWHTFPETVEIFPDGEVLYRQKSWGTFSQPFDLRDFPLDRQKLIIHYVTAGLLEDEVKLVPLTRDAGRRSGIASKFSLPDFEILSWKAVPMPYTPFEGEIGTAGFQMEIEVGRRVLYYLAKMIIPLCLIVMMSWVPLWTDQKEIGSNLGIAATAFLTLVAYYFAMTFLLPRVSYLTRMDKFIILSTILVFASLLQTVKTTNMVKRNEDQSLKKIIKWSRIVYPIMLILVLFYSFWL